MVEKELKIQKIKNGTVIDHLPQDTALDVLRILNIDGNTNHTVSLIMNIKGKTGTKDIVKVEDKILKPEETDKIALIAPNATVNVIKNYKVVKKNVVKLPEKLENVLKCANPNCITNKNEPITACFKVEGQSPTVLRCDYCERLMEETDIKEQL